MSTPLTRLLGLGLRARTVVIGVEGVRAQLHRDALRCVVVAADAGERARDKVERLAVARGVTVLAGPPAAELGADLGRRPVQVIGVSDRALARGVIQACGGV